MSSQVNWKSRYAELLTQQEKQQHRYKKKSTLLTQALSDAVVLSKGIDQGADDKLLALQGLLRRDSVINVDLEAAAKALSKQTQVSLKVRQSALKELLHSMKLISRQVRDGSVDKSTVRILRDFEKNLSMKSKKLADVPALLAQLVPLHNRAVDQILDQQGGKPTLLGRLLGGSANEVVEIPDESVLCDQRIIDELEYLLEQTIGLESLIDDHEALYRSLQQDIRLGSLPDAVASISRAISSTLKDDQLAFEDFLSQINERLQEANASLMATQIIHDKGEGLGEKFGLSLKENMSRIRSFVSGSTDIDTLKKSVNDNVDQMMLVVESHLSEEQERQAELSIELGKLTKKVRQLEEHASETNAKLNVQKAAARTDPLTQLPNREAYTERAEKEIVRWSRYSRPLCIAVIDIDHFKVVNDTYGHAAGDEALVGLSKCLQNRLRDTDFVARFGGEEFVVLLPETSDSQALLVMESLREAVSQLQIKLKDISFNLTISIGISQFQGKDNLESAFTRADKALYRAKESGRNQALLASPP